MTQADTVWGSNRHNSMPAPEKVFKFDLKYFLSNSGAIGWFRLLLKYKILFIISSTKLTVQAKYSFVL